ncbi:alcohol dehydrogenase family protein [Aliamphritea ceti]|uniref:alcohol dehydrogenase family protein n=1 Tax=Aliamphritea ceti TaxID=1524258 RepID=UPI0021C43880|nr:alcohol dehydrogenase family protein [Aliamphritea ceti]
MSSNNKSAAVPQTMAAVQLTGHGGFDQLSYRTDVPVPTPSAGEVLIKVGASAINNTDINTRIGWYSKAVSGDTNTGGSEGFDDINDDDASWSGIPLQLPRIQGCDCCGEIVAVGEGVDQSRLGERVLVRNLQQPAGSDNPFECFTYGSECDGSYAEFTTAQSREAFAVNSTMTDAELASFPCAYSTAENMLDRMNLSDGERLLITGASGGVGSAAVQLAKRRGARVIAVCSPAKSDELLELGAEQVIHRGDNLLKALGKDSLDGVVDLVAGNQWPELLDILRPGGRYAVAGAIAGPLVELDVRSLYLKDLTFFGCTYQPRHVFENLVKYIEKGEIKPLVAKSYPLENIIEAQQTFLNKGFTGKLVLLPQRNN